MVLRWLSHIIGITKMKFNYSMWLFWSVLVRSNENSYENSFNNKSFNNSIDTFISFQLHPSSFFFYKTSLLFKCGRANIIRAQNVIFKNLVIQNIFKQNVFIPAVLKLGVATLFRVTKYCLRVAKIYQNCPFTKDSLKVVPF